MWLCVWIIDIDFEEVTPSNYYRIVLVSLLLSVVIMSGTGRANTTCCSSRCCPSWGPGMVETWTTSGGSRMAPPATSPAWTCATWSTSSRTGSWGRGWQRWTQTWSSHHPGHEVQGPLLHREKRRPNEKWIRKRRTIDKIWSKIIFFASIWQVSNCALFY